MFVGDRMLFGNKKKVIRSRNRVFRISLKGEFETSTVE